MTTVRYIRRPHRAPHQTYEYTRATSDWVTWAHAVWLLVLVAVLIAAVQCAGGTFMVAA